TTIEGMTRSARRTSVPEGKHRQSAVSLRAKDMDAAIREAKATCPLSKPELEAWAKQLNLPKPAERQLKGSITYWFMQAQSLDWVGSALMQARRREYTMRRLAAGHAPETIQLPEHFDRVDLWLPEIAARLTAVRSELTSLTGEVDAALRHELG